MTDHTHTDSATESSANKISTELSQERADLLASLTHARHFLRFPARDLTDEQAAAHPTASVLSVGGVIKHVAEVEQSWARFITGGAAAMNANAKDFADWTAEDFAEREKGFQLLPGETLAGVLADHQRAAEATDRLVTTESSLDRLIELPKTPWSTEETWSVRRVFQHIIAETTQHAGHADIIRETIDGAKSMG